MLTRVRRYPNSHPHGTSSGLGVVNKGQKISKFPPPWNFKLTWSAHQGKKISNFPPPWNFKLTWSGQQGSEDINTPTPMELQVDLEWSTRVRRYQHSHPHGTSSGLGVVNKGQKISKFPPPWNFKLTYRAHQGKKISKFPPPWNFMLTWSAHQGKKISKFPPPRNFKLTWSAHQGKKIPKFPPPWNFKWTLECSTRVRRYQYSHPHGTSS